MSDKIRKNFYKTILKYAHDKGQFIWREMHEDLNMNSLERDLSIDGTKNNSLFTRGGSDSRGDLFTLSISGWDRYLRVIQIEESRSAIDESRDASEVTEKLNRQMVYLTWTILGLTFIMVIFGVIDILST